MSLKLAVDILFKYYLEHSKLYELKNYPFDFKVLLELMSSCVIPILVVVLEFIF